jgi:hypothetical protein
MASKVRRPTSKQLRLGPIALTSLCGMALPVLAAADEPRPQLVPLTPAEVPSLPPASPPPPATPPTDPSSTPYPAPGYARWVLPPAPSDDYIYDLPPETEGRHTGFFMRLALGPGYYRMWAASAEGTMQLRAAGGGLNLTMGGALSENFVLYGEAALQSTLDPEVDTYAGEAGRPGTSVTTAALGAGVGYHLMPAQVYFAASLLVAQARAVDRPTEQLLGKTDLGPGLALSLGKDWWMSPHWTIGVMGRMQLARLRDPRHGKRGAMWDALGLSAAFTVAFE